MEPEERAKLADKVYDILVEVCGAPKSMRDDFIYHFVNINPDHGLEYRFGGNLGMGGKLLVDLRLGAYRDARITCYPENLTVSVGKMIAEANWRLGEVVPSHLYPAR